MFPALMYCDDISEAIVARPLLSRAGKCFFFLIKFLIAFV